MTKTNDMKDQEWLCPVKPEEIPVEYTYVAQDYAGRWFAFEEEPITFETVLGWCIPHKSVFFNHLLCEGEYNPNWRKTLQKIPR